MSDSARTPLHDWHVEQGGRMVDFAGWSMPVQFTSIVEEHLATRSHAGLFDISHMGRVRFRGGDACRFLDQLLTRRVADLAPGAIRYSLVTNEAGGILDDVLVYRLPDPEQYLLVVNAGNRRKILDWFQQHRPSPLGGDPLEDVQWEDETEATVMLALQGPRALVIAQTLVEDALRLTELRYYHCSNTRMVGQSVLVSRTGYTGEDGCEMIIARDGGLELARRIVDSGAAHGLRMAGLGARDTLRLEAGMPLYGHELSEEIDPYQAGLAFAVQLSGRRFVGSDALARRKQATPARKRVGLALSGRRVPREGYPVLSGETEVGTVTSGTYSPTLERPIAMALVQTSALKDSANLAVVIRGTRQPATLVQLPFYRRTDPAESG
jgi:aminomethyltransferase